jgi:uncharacterized protein YndB with AHSA1/START domain
MTKTSFTFHPDKPEIVIERIFDAPRELVFKMCTNPSFIPKWWGSRSFATTVEKMDLRVGGAWRFVQRDKAGKIYAFHGVYREIIPNEKIVYAFEFEDMPGKLLTETVIFEDFDDDKTRMIDKPVFSTIADRDGMVKSGIEADAAETMDHFSDLLSKN